MTVPSSSTYPDDPARDEAPHQPWEAIAAGKDFRALLRSKAQFIVAATAFFLIYYFALPVLSGYWPALMGRKVMGQFSLAYLFALSQFPMAWLVAALYLRAASRFDREAAAVLARHHATLQAAGNEEDSE